MKTSLLVFLARKSLWYRRTSIAIVLIGLTTALTLLLALHRLHHHAEHSFVRSVQGPDLIVGARAGDVQLLLATVFQIGGHPDTLSWKTYEDILARPEVNWAVPLVSGDSHRGYRLLGVAEGFYEHVRFGGEDTLSFSAGGRGTDVFDIVLGAAVAEELDYDLGQQIIVTHGAGPIENDQMVQDQDNSLYSHADRPFTVCGILRPTGTPIDRQLIVSLVGYEALHADWIDGQRPTYHALSMQQLRALQLLPERLNAIYVGLNQPQQALGMQYWLRTYEPEPVSGVIPGVAMLQLWRVVGSVENILSLFAWGTMAIALAGLVASMLAMVRERSPEMAILRAVGLPPDSLTLLVCAEALLVGCVAVVLAWICVALATAWGGSLIQQQFGVAISTFWPSNYELAMSLGMLAAVIITAIPGGILAQRSR